MPGNRHDGTYCDYFHPRHGLPDAALNSGPQEGGASFPTTHIFIPLRSSVRTDSDDLGARSYFLDDGFDASTPGLFFIFSSSWQLCAESNQPNQQA